MENKKKAKFNIVDALVILIILALAAAVVHVFFGKEASEAGADKVVCTAEITVYGLEPEIAQEIIDQNIVGQHTVAGTQYTKAVITDIAAEENREDAALKNIVACLSVEVAENTTGAVNANQELRVGKDYILKTRTVECEGVVTKVEIGGKAR